jgi:hypothetical protein
MEYNFIIRYEYIKINIEISKNISILSFSEIENFRCKYINKYIFPVISKIMELCYFDCN